MLKAEIHIVASDRWSLQEALEEVLRRLGDDDYTSGCDWNEDSCYTFAVTNDHD